MHTTKRKRYATRTESQANQNLGRTKKNATLLGRHATLTKLRVQRKHNVGTWRAYAPKQHTADQKPAPMLMNRDHKRYKRKHSHSTAPQTANTPPKIAKNTRDQSSLSLTTKIVVKIKDQERSCVSICKIFQIFNCVKVC